MYTILRFPNLDVQRFGFTAVPAPSLCSGDCSMANLNKVMLIGRLTRDPETRAFPNGGKVAKFGFAVNYTARKKNQDTGQWEGEAVFIDIEAFNSTREGGRQLADLVEQYLRKGQQVYIEGR